MTFNNISSHRIVGCAPPKGSYVDCNGKTRTPLSKPKTLDLKSIDFSKKSKEMHNELNTTSDLVSTLPNIWSNLDEVEKNTIEKYVKFLKNPIEETSTELLEGVAKIGGKYIFSKICKKYMTIVEEPNDSDKDKHLCDVYAFEKNNVEMNETPIDKSLETVDEIMHRVGYLPTERFCTGVFIIYFNDNKEATHVGYVKDGQIISKMGWSGVYKHNIDQTFPEYGKSYRLYCPQLRIAKK